MKPREQILKENPLDSAMEKDGINLIKTPQGWKAKCPFHEDKNPSLSITGDVFFCHGCKATGSVIDYVSRRDGVSVSDAFKKLSGEPVEPFKPTPAARGEIDTIYSYRDETGQELYQVVRMKPKDFRQRHQENGKWVWNMQNVRRVLYNLPALLKANASFIWVVEGEKDAENLKKCGMVATTNVGGAGKWLDGYSDTLAGKELLLCGDNDDAGRAHMSKVLEAVCKKAKTVRHVVIPAPHKDVSGFIESFDDTEKAAKALFDMFEAAPVLTGGVLVPVQTMAELEREYEEFVRECQTSSLNLGAWLPSLGRNVRRLVPGELIVILADTGVGKTACLQNLAIHAAPVPTLLFELELPGTLLFERFVSMATQTAGESVFTQYNAGGKVDWRKAGNTDHIVVCQKSGLTPEEIEKIIIQTELKTGKRPKLVLVDYMGLIRGLGKSRYERVSYAAEQLKVIAKSTRTIIAVASQVTRPDGYEPEIFLHDGKDSGSIENSAGLVLGAWRDAGDSSLLKLKVLKNTKGRPNFIIDCNFNGATMTITERGKIGAEDVPGEQWRAD